MHTSWLLIRASKVNTQRFDHDFNVLLDKLLYRFSPAPDKCLIFLHGRVRREVERGSWTQHTRTRLTFQLARRTCGRVHEDVKNLIEKVLFQSLSRVLSLSLLSSLSLSRSLSLSSQSASLFSLSLPNLSPASSSPSVLPLSLPPSSSRTFSLFHLSLPIYFPFSLSLHVYFPHVWTPVHRLRRLVGRFYHPVDGFHVPSTSPNPTSRHDLFILSLYRVHQSIYPSLSLEFIYLSIPFSLEFIYLSLSLFRVHLSIYTPLSLEFIYLYLSLFRVHLSICTSLSLKFIYLSVPLSL